VRSPLLGPSAQPERKACSERSAEAIDVEVARLLGEAHHRVRVTLAGKRPLLDLLAQTLLQKESLDRAAFDALLSSKAALPAPQEDKLAPVDR